MTIAGHVYNVLIVATMHATVYAFDADTPGRAALWTLSTGTPWTTNQLPAEPSSFYNAEMGCIATPVSDGGNFVYALCANNTPATQWRIFKIDVRDGTSSNAAFTASVTGTGDPNGAPDNVSGGVLTFYPKYAICRIGLTYANSQVYAGCASADVDPWHGWIISYDSSLTQQHVWCSTPNGFGGGIWQSGGGPAVDGSGNLYVITGNGDWNGTSNFGMTAAKLSPNLALLDWYTPTNWSALNDSDIDLGSGHPMLIPSTNLLAWCAKDFNCYAVDTTCMGHLGGTVGGCTAPQILQTRTPPANAQAGAYGNAFMNGKLIATVTDLNNNTDLTTVQSLYSFALTGSTFAATPTASTAKWNYPGAILSGSINASTNGILWAITVTAGASGAWDAAQSATLRALNPADFSEYWNSGSTGANAPGQLAKFVQPTIAAGKIYVATLNSGVAVFGVGNGAVTVGPVAIKGPTAH